MKVVKYKFFIVAVIVFFITIFSSFTNLFIQLEEKIYDLFMQPIGHIALTNKVSRVAI